MDFKQNKDYQAIQTIISSLECQLQDIEQIQPQDFNAMKREVKEHFRSCINALNDRENSLINQITDTSQKQSMEIAKMKDDIAGHIEARQDILNVGLKKYKTHVNIAEQIWKGACSLELPTIDTQHFSVRIKLPSSLLETISSHGAVSSTISSESTYKLSSQDSIFMKSKDFQNMQGDDKNFAGSTVQATLTSSTSTHTTTASLFFPSTSDQLSTSITPTIYEKYSVIGIKDTVSTFAGSTKGYTDGNGKKVQFNAPFGICFDPNDDSFYICDFENKAIRKLTLQGAVSTVVKVSACPREIVAYHRENILFATCGHSIIKIAPSGKIKIFVGEIHKSGCEDGIGTKARFDITAGITIDQKSGNIYTSDFNNNLIRKITQKRQVATFAGVITEGANRISAKFSHPRGLCFNEEDQSVMVCDEGHNKIRHLSIQGEVTTICEVIVPRRIAITPTANFWIASQNKIILLIKQGPKRYKVHDLVGSYEQKTVDGSAKESSFNWPNCIAVHEPSNSCFVTELEGNTVRRITFL